MGGCWAMRMNVCNPTSSTKGNGRPCFPIQWSPPYSTICYNNKNRNMCKIKMSDHKVLDFIASKLKSFFFFFLHPNSNSLQFHSTTNYQMQPTFFISSEVEPLSLRLHFTSEEEFNNQSLNPGALHSQHYYKITF